MSGGATLQVRGLSKRFGRVTALAGVDLAVESGELVVVLGPTGAGKTTLLRTLAGLERPDEGAVSIAGEDVTATPPAARDVALVFQNFSLYPGWTVRANLEFPLRAPGRDLDEARIAERVAWAASILRIERLLDRPAERLSGGEMQRVAIGRAIVRRPRLFLMDEPLSNLDAKLREALRVEIVTLARELGVPTLYVTHDQAEALSMADRIAVLSAGRVLQCGPREDIYLRPASPEVARLLGQPAINVLEVTARGGAWRLKDGSPVLATGAPDGASARIGLRPEHVAPDGGELPGRVEVVEERGPDRVLLVRWAGEELHLVVPRRGVHRPGDELRPRLDPERAVLWAQDSAAPATSAGGGEGLGA